MYILENTSYIDFICFLSVSPRIRLQASFYRHFSNLNQ
nr:MAG TPA: hypothetical protein [Caudoviricetes sp.]